MKLSLICVRVQHIAAATAVVMCGFGALAPDVYAQGPRNTATPQKLDEEYTARIKKATPDARISTELVDHMPASATVPSPLKFLGYVPLAPNDFSNTVDAVERPVSLGAQNELAVRLAGIPGSRILIVLRSRDWQ